MNKINRRCNGSEKNGLNTNEIFFNSSYVNQESVVLPRLLSDVRKRMKSAQYSGERAKSQREYRTFRIGTESIGSEHELTLTQRIAIALENGLIS